MKLHVLLIIGFILGVTGCQQNEPAEPEQATTAPAAESMAAEDPTADKTSYQYAGIIRHMHRHADQIDLLNNALDDGDLDASKTPARWLWRHDTMSGVPTEWQPFLARMREAARAAENAADIETARAAAKRITEQCQACHTAVGIVDDGLERVPE